MTNKLKTARTMLPDNPAPKCMPPIMDDLFHAFSLQTRSDCSSSLQLTIFGFGGLFSAHSPHYRNCCSPSCIHYRLHSHSTCKNLQFGEQHTCKIELVWSHHHQGRGLACSYSVRATNIHCCQLSL